MNLTVCALAMLFALTLGATVPAQFSKNLTVYHLNPVSAGSLPINMDTGDALGDLYFYLGQFLLPLECKNVSAQSRAHFDCDNAERTGDLVVTSVELEIDSRTTSYSGCNLCNGTDPLSGDPCEVGTYICDCEERGRGVPPCDSSKVGVSNITSQFAPSPPIPQCTRALSDLCGADKHNASACFSCVEDHWGSLLNSSCVQNLIYDFCPNPWNTCPKHNWGCWQGNIPRLTAGFWYSTQKEGYCAPGSSAPCSWAVHGMKTINETCMRESVIQTVESYDRRGCFPQCGARNTSSACWINCFFGTLLGPEAAHSYTKPLTGMSASQIQEAWTNAFLPEAQGGCPEISMRG